MNPSLEQLERRILLDVVPVADVNGDGCINAIDLSYAWANRTTAVDDTEWSEVRSDVTADGRVNALDLSLIWSLRGGAKPPQRDITDPEPMHECQWADFAGEPVFKDGPDHDDIIQGAVGDCCFLACLSGLAHTDRDLLRAAIPLVMDDGTFVVRFYRDSKPRYVLIDGDLPVDGGGNPMYAKLTPDGETWVALLEKAYCGDCYASIDAGEITCAFTDLTNAPTSTTWTFASEQIITDTLLLAVGNGYPVALESKMNCPGPIISGHAYALHSVRQGDTGLLVTVYNPWGIDGTLYDPNPYDGLLELNIAQIKECFSAIVLSLT